MGAAAPAPPPAAGPHEAASVGDWDGVRHVDRLLLATKLNAEMRRASTRSGHQLLDVARTAIGGPAIERWSREVRERRSPGCQPVSTAVVYAACGVDVLQAVASDLAAFCTSYLGAALRLRLADHREVQVMLHALAPVVEQVAVDAVDRELADLGGCAPMADVVSAQHERAEARLFTS